MPRSRKVPTLLLKCLAWSPTLVAFGYAYFVGSISTSLGILGVVGVVLLLDLLFMGGFIPSTMNLALEFFAPPDDRKDSLWFRSDDSEAARHNSASNPSVERSSDD